MLCPLDVEAPLQPALHKHHPLELHWRKHPPTPRGGFEKAMYGAYPHLAHEILCMQCGAIPCPYTHDDTDKKQRLADMEFIKELAKDRRVMKEELLKMGEKMSQMKERENDLVLDKEVLRSTVSQYAAQEEEWKHTKMLLDAEIRRLKLLNEQNKDFLDEFKKDRLKLQYIQQKLEDTELENARLRQENEKILQRLLNQSDEISELNKKNEALTTELEKSKGKMKQLVVQIQESKDELNKARKQLREKDVTIIEMERKVSELVEELTDKTTTFERKEIEFESLIKELKNLVENLKQTNQESETKIKDLLKMVQMLEEEVEMLKKKLASDTRFRQFVEIKRECNTLKDISGNIAQKLQDYENKRPLPAVKNSGKISKKSKAFGPGARPKTSLLSRPKSPKVTLRQTHMTGERGELADLDDFDDESRPSTAQLYHNRPKSSRSLQFRSPTVVSCGDDAEMYILDDDPLGSRPNSALNIGSRPNSAIRGGGSSRHGHPHPHRSHSSLYSHDRDKAETPMSQNWSRPSSARPSSAMRTESPGVHNQYSKKQNVTSGGEDIVSKDHDNLSVIDDADHNGSPVDGLSLEEVNRMNEDSVGHQIHVTPESSEVGSDLDNFSFEPMDEEKFT